MTRTPEKPRKLVLARDTLRRLSHEELSRAAGAFIPLDVDELSNATCSTITAGSLHEALTCLCQKGPGEEI
jgi:hypothetical protein